MSNKLQPCKACGKPTNYILVISPDKIVPVCKSSWMCQGKVING